MSEAGPGRLRLGVLEVLRDITRGALANGLLGLIVLGLGGRVVMRLQALLHPEVAGRLTENGNRIGEITFEGTLALLFFGGLLMGLVAAVVWVAVAPWIPGAGLRRAALVAPIAVALSGFLLVESDNRDFRILDSDPVVIGLLLGLIAAFGFLVALLDDWLDRRLPSASRAAGPAMVAYAFAVLVGTVAVFPMAVGTYFSRQVCFCEPAVPVGLAILATGAATVAWWALRATGRSRPPRSLSVIGGIGVLAAVGLGTLRVAQEVGRILATE